MLAEGGRDWRRGVLDVAVLWTVRLGSILAVALLVSLGLQQPARLLEPAVMLMFAAYAGLIALRLCSLMEYRGRAFGFCSLLFVMGV
ncbi:MAG TPA: hypothetical protein VMG12_30865, partial [Polyangiaceae bacterium]|nr:hypothetical protein [Polyangiaceae bacterium]